MGGGGGKKGITTVTELGVNIPSGPPAMLGLVITMKLTERENPQREKQKLLPPVPALSIAWLRDKILYLQ